MWYVAYGSNTRWEGLRRYLGPAAARPESRWCRIPHALYFAGTSRRWDGGVAFVTLAAGPPSAARAWRITTEQLHAVAAAENGTPDLPPPPDPAGVAVGHAALLPVTPGGGGALGKYDALLRVPDIDGAPAVTLTTSRALPARPPGDAYLATVRAGLAAHLPDVDAYLAAAVARGAPAV